MIDIEVIDGPQDIGKHFEFDDYDNVIIGRSSACRVALDDPETSRSHAQILLEDGVAVLQDLGSRNGTLLNGVPVKKAKLGSGDRILLGTTLLCVTLPEEQDGMRAAPVRFREDEQSVLMTINHRDADMLRGKSTASVNVEEMRHENDVLRQICQISQLLASKQSTQEIIQQILEALQHTAEADTVCVLTRMEGEDEDWAMRATTGQGVVDGAISVSRTIISKALQDGMAILSTDPLSDDRFDASKSIVAHGVSSALCSPLQMGASFGGVLFMDRRKRRDSFDAMDLRLAATVGNMLGVLLEKERYELEVQQKARLAVIGEVVAGLAHYIKNVITGFNLSVSNLEMALEKKKYDWMAPCVKIIGSMERRVSDLMLNMLSYAKDRKPEPAPTDVRKMIADMVAPYAGQLEEKGIEFESECPPEITHVYAEERSLFRVFLNLFLNAIDSMESKDGEKKIRVTVSQAPKGGGVEFRFRDTGKGIPADKLKQIFAAFFSTKGSRGTGLGLAVVLKIVEEHGGTISVDSVEGEWTEFCITLPPEPSA